MLYKKIHNCLISAQKCALCDASAPDAHGICSSCHADLPWLLNPCRCCALPLPRTLAPGGLCAHCVQTPPAFERTLAAFNYDFPISQLLPNIKYQRQPAHLGWLARVLAAYLQQHYEDDWPDALMAVPMHPFSELKRGFNQAQLLAARLSQQLQLPLNDSLRKTRRTPHQAELGLNARRGNLHHAFAVTEQPPRHLALIDDIMTTGTTVNTLAQVLKSAGAERVDIWVLARTPEMR
ncbi:ComF family protein [Marinobacterium marinum]|uniref:ComF family protein n=1 Tax=Marinobacterium marinum TaxID=2756129 RepID=A0A7W1WWE7_9GAMM|nr:ComF family protein [Marinobacterium marinum]MBA4501453.1 ComF family protein [Marinobacterium marinum]